MQTKRVQVVCKLYVRIRVVCLYAFPNIVVVFCDTFGGERDAESTFNACGHTQGNALV